MLTLTWYHATLSAIQKKRAKQMENEIISETEKKRREIFLYVKNYIQRNKLKANDPLPSENTLAERFGANRNTVRSALTALKVQGLIYSHKGKGFFVAERPKPIMLTHDVDRGFSEMLDEAELDYRSELLSVISRPASKQEQRYLGLTEEDTVYVLKQLRIINEINLALCYSVIPQKSIEGFESRLDEFRGTNHIFIDLFGYEHPVCVKTMISAHNPDAETVKLLEMPEGIPAIQQENIYHLPDGSPIEYFVIKARADLFRIQLNFDPKKYGGTEI